MCIYGVELYYILKEANLTYSDRRQVSGGLGLGVEWVADCKGA